jgi:hypothetical protein
MPSLSVLLRDNNTRVLKNGSTSSCALTNLPGARDDNVLAGIIYDDSFYGK